MLKHNLSVKDQFGVKHSIQATVDQLFANTQSHSNIKHITQIFSSCFPYIDFKLF